MWRQWVRERVADPTETVLRKRTLTFVIVDVVLALALVWMNLMVQDLGYRIEYAGSLIDRLDHEHSELIAEHAQLTLAREAASPGRRPSRPRAAARRTSESGPCRAVASSAGV